MTPYDVVTFGEAMVRLSPPGFQRVEQARSLDVEVGGAELNVAVGMVRLGLRGAWISKLPENPLGRLIGGRARATGVDCSHIIWTPRGRAGLYFFEFGASPRPSSVLYDRAGSAMSTIGPGEIPWVEILRGARHFHVTGITPALSPSAAQATLEALNAARAAGCTVSYDINYRQKLWEPGEARRVQEPLLAHVDILFTNEHDPRVVLEAAAGDPGELAGELARRYGLRIVAVTVKTGRTLWRDQWTAVAYGDGAVFRDGTYDVEIVDRLGAGDAFAAGFLAVWLRTRDVARALRWGNALAALKHTFPGDFAWASPTDVEDVLSGAGPRLSR
jgi:2-dehydro-3-deoxygluconokinase